MREWIDIVSGKSVINEGVKAPFKLVPGLDESAYSITDSLADWQKWRAKVYLANNGGANDLGKKDGIGYVWISTKDNTIIPIARNDEHHQGGDVVSYLIEEGIISINARDYYPVWAAGDNYIYNKTEIPLWLNILAKFVSYGGINGMLQGSRGLQGMMMTSKQFVDCNGNIDVEPGELNHAGKEFYSIHKRLSDVFMKALGTGKHAPAFKAAMDMIPYYKSISGFYQECDSKVLSDLRSSIAKLRIADDINGLMTLFFGFDSIKQKIHVDLKRVRDHAAAGKPDIWHEKYAAFWGDLGLAADMLADL